MKYKYRDYSLMGIVNLTDNSFLERSRMAGKSIDEVIERVAGMAECGAEYIDVGACSIAPGVAQVSAEVELSRLEKVLPPLMDAFPHLKFSVDTYRPEVVAALAKYGKAFIVNDVKTADLSSDMVALTASLGFEYIAMDSSSDPYSFFEVFAERAAKAGLDSWILDPGFGFGKSVEQNWEVLEKLPALRDFGRPVLAALSHKRMIFMPLGLTPATCSLQSVQAELRCVELGADIIRTHDLNIHSHR